MAKVVGFTEMRSSESCVCLYAQQRAGKLRRFTVILLHSACGLTLDEVNVLLQPFEQHSFHLTYDATSLDVATSRSNVVSLSAEAKRSDNLALEDGSNS